MTVTTPPAGNRSGQSHHLLRVLKKAIRNPKRACLRLVLRARLAADDESRARHRLLTILSQRWGVDAQALHAEYAGSPFAQWYRGRLAELLSSRASFRLGTSGFFALEALYLLIRAARPRMVVETGVLYGASSGHILAALKKNGKGELHSIDLPGNLAEPPNDFFVPKELVGRWSLTLGDSRHELPRLLERLGRIDMFHHDSLHTFEHMTWEFETVLPYLEAGGILSSDDILVADGLSGIFKENAFPAFCRRRRLGWGAYRSIGLAIVGETPPTRP